MITIEEKQPVAMQSLASVGGEQGAVFRFADGEVVVKVTYTDIEGPWEYQVEGRMVKGKPAITALAMVPSDRGNPTPLTKDAVRRTPVGSVLARVREALLEEWRNQQEGSGTRLVERLGTDALTKRVKKGRSWSSDHFAQVAWFCIDAELTGRAPREAVAERWSVSKVTATRWMAKARGLGYLPDAPEPPHRPRTEIEAQVEATRTLERRVVNKVLAAGLGPQKLSDSARSGEDVLELLRPFLYGESSAAQRLRAEMCVLHLMLLSGGEGNDDAVREAAAALLEALTGEAEPSST